MMGTYAVYNLWVGVKKTEVEEVLSSRPDLDEHWILKALNSSIEINVVVDRNDESTWLKLEPIYMHGENIGFGVVIQELDWTDELDDTNEYKLGNDVADSALDALNDFFSFQQQEFPFTAKLYHHIDLGG